MTDGGRGAFGLLRALAIPIGFGVAVLLDSGGGLLHSAGAAAAPSLRFKDGPPVRSTGGFGEESCIGCHFGADENDGVGTLSIEGVPDRYVPGESYPIVVRLTRPEMQAGGFQLAARLPDGVTQAGTFTIPEEESARVGRMLSRDVAFLHHTWDGAELTAPDTAAWELHWTAPTAPGLAVHFHAAGVAADDDDSQLGDFVYTSEVVVGGD